MPARWRSSPDITSRASFDSDDDVIADVRAQRGNDVIIVLVGNKTDLVSQREVSAAEIEQQRQRAGDHVH